MLLKFFLVVLIIFSTNLFARTKKTGTFWSKAKSYHVPAYTTLQNAFATKLTLSYFNTMSKYDHLGNEVEFLDGESFSKIDTDLDARYGFGKQFELMVGARYRQNNSTEAEAETITSSGIESFFLGGKYMFSPLNKWNYSIELIYRARTYSNPVVGSGDVNEIVLGDDYNEFTIGGYLSFLRSSHHFISTYLAYNMPAGDASTELLYFLESAWPYEKWAFMIGVKGVYAMGDDAYSDNPSSKPAIYKGTTNLYNSVNHESISPYFGINYAFSDFRFEIQGSQVISGISTDAGWEAVAALHWSSKGVDKETVKIQTFKEYTVEAGITKISPQRLFIKIDKGLSANVDKGRTVDIYKVNYLGGNILIATGIVYDAGSNTAIVKIMRRFKNIPITLQFVARIY